MAARSPAVSTVDLHTHTTASDGANTPAELVHLAATRGIRSLAVTDHDSTEGLADALSAAAGVGIEVVPGVELSTAVPAGELHLLGYFIDPQAEALQRTLTAFRESRRARAEQIVRQLRQAGVPLDPGLVEREAGNVAVTRAHVARALVASGAATSVNDAFARYLSRGKVGYVPRSRLTPREAIQVVRKAGGVPVLAHPYSVADLDAALPALIAAGLQGLEAFYAEYREEQRSALAALAHALDLVPTGGSDFHGTGEREGRELGSVVVPPASVARLRTLAGYTR